jgi:hypothetical protein
MAAEHFLDQVVAVGFEGFLLGEEFVNRVGWILGHAAHDATTGDLCAA